MRYVILAIIASLVACAHSKPKEACDYTAEEFTDYLGESEPKVLDLDGDGTITPEDRSAWINRCGPEE